MYIAVVAGVVSPYTAPTCRRSREFDGDKTGTDRTTVYPREETTHRSVNRGQLVNPDGEESVCVGEVSAPGAGSVVLRHS